jgi:hypothetical protein
MTAQPIDAALLYTAFGSKFGSWQPWLGRRVRHGFGRAAPRLGDFDCRSETNAVILSLHSGRSGGCR